MKKFGKIRTLFFVIVLVLSVAVGCVACTSGSNGKNYDNSAERSDSYMSYMVDISLDVSDLDKTSTELEGKAVEIGGDLKRFSGNETYYKQILFRVPSDKLSEFVEYVKKQGEVEYYYFSGENLADEYNNSKARKAALEKQYAELGELLEKEGITVAEEKDLIETRRAIYEEILTYQEKIEAYENQVDFSDVCVYLYQKEEPEEELSFWDKLGKVLSGSAGSIGKVFGWLFMALVAILPYAGILAGIFGLYVLIKFIVCKIRKKPFTLFAKLRANRAYRKKRQEEIQKEYEEKRNPETPSEEK